MTRGRCAHGEVPGDGPAITVTGSRERRVEEHEKKCRGARVFNHPGWLGRIVCCATCGRKVC